MKLSLSSESPRLQNEFEYNNNKGQKFKYYNKDIPNILKQIGFNKIMKLTDTLQGSVYRASHTENVNTRIRSVIKITNIDLHNKSAALIDDKLYKCNEDILLEQSILKYLTQYQLQENDCPQSIVKFISFFKSKYNYFLLMEDGGASLFDFIHKSHDLIQEGNIEISHWIKVCKVIFKQMMECIDFMHGKNVAHFDISIENFVINDVKVEIIKKSSNKSKSDKETLQLQFIMDSIQIKLCDFGLAQLFTTSDAKSSKFVGKSNYKSPEIHRKMKGFDAKSNDVWCVGVVLWCMICGIAPFTEAKQSDESFMLIVHYNKMVQLLSCWGLLHYFDKDLFQLIDAIFQYEKNRISVKEIKAHPWMK